MLPAGARASGGAYVVDSSEIGDLGECAVESWVSLASNHDAIAVTSPTCVVNLGTPVELGATVARSRSDGAWSTAAGPKAKINLIPLKTGPIGIGLSGTTAWDTATGEFAGGTLSALFSIQAADGFLINVNAGGRYDAPNRLNYASWGAGFEWTAAKKIALIAEVYGYAGTATSPGATDPRAQLGLRYMPTGKIDVDFIYGRNIAGENANWLTLGLNLRF